MSAEHVRDDVRAFLDTLEANPRPTFTADLIAMIRSIPPETMAATMAELDLPVGDLEVVRDFVVPGPAGDIAVRMFDPRAHRGAGPVVVFFHGGGYVLGSIETHASLAAQMARELDLPVVSVEYRLAPENPWPAAPDDAETVTRWIADHPNALGPVATGLVLAGDSAGGNLALVTALACRDRPAALPIRLVVALYPATDSTRSYPSREAYSDGYGLESVNLGLYHQHYAADSHSWRASPLLADLADSPPTLVVTAAFDPLRDEGRAYAAKSVAAGVDTTYVDIPGTIHGFASFRRDITSAVDDLSRIMQLARGHLEQNS